MLLVKVMKKQKVSLSPKLRKKLKKIKIFATDVDGVLTDGRIFLDASGEWRRFFHLRDGMGLKLIQKAGIKTAIITTSKSQDIQLRAQKLGIDYFFEGIDDKTKALEELIKKSKVKPDEILFIGDDVIDLPVLKNVGVSVAVHDAEQSVLATCDAVTSKKGGQGAVREVCNWVLKERARK
jgi:3-deoxy-D-manno-octulosonate 8-phosphate phosphatase (KDO 8-P phosphatase)